MTSECESRVNVKFEEPIALGMRKIVNGWLKEYLKSSSTSESIQEDDSVPGEDTDIDYELYTTAF